MITDRYNATAPEPHPQAWEYRLENDPRFLRRIAKARKSLRSGRGVRLEDVK